MTGSGMKDIHLSDKHVKQLKMGVGFVSKARIIVRNANLTSTSTLTLWYIGWVI